MNLTLSVKETTRRHQANRRLHALTRNCYFESIPVAQVQAILAKHGFQPEPLDGIYCGAQGQIDPPAQVGEHTWCCLSWYRMGSGRYEITCYLS